MHHHFFLFLLPFLAACPPATVEDSGDSTSDSGTTDTDATTGDVDGDGFTEADGDCDDADPETYPGARDECDGVDQDCDGELDEDGPRSFYPDADGDGFGDSSATPIESCDDVSGHTTKRNDCDDNDPSAYPGATDTDPCDGTDQTCAGSELQVPADHATIQAGIDAAKNGDRVCVAAGTYNETLSVNGKKVHLIGIDGPEVTIVDAGGTARVLGFNDGETRATIVEGFTLTDGDWDDGGAIDIFDASPTLRNLIIRGNQGKFGGGIRSRYGDPLLENLLVEDNDASARGGGIELDGGEPVLRNVWVRNNSAGSWGGGIYWADADATFENARIEGNLSGTEGGGVYVVGRVDTTFRNILILDNISHLGGGVSLNTEEIPFENVTIVGNEGNDGGGLYLFGFAEAVFTNTIVANNTADQGGGVYLDPEYTPTISASYSVFTGNTPDLIGGRTGVASPVGSDNNVDTNPNFVSTSGDVSSWDLHAQGLSDVGDPSIADPDTSPSEIGAYGGPGAGSFDLDADGVPEWWQPTPWMSSYTGFECDDRNLGGC